MDETSNQRRCMRTSIRRSFNAKSLKKKTYNKFLQVTLITLVFIYVLFYSFLNYITRVSQPWQIHVSIANQLVIMNVARVCMLHKLSHIFAVRKIKINGNKMIFDCFYLSPSLLFYIIRNKHTISHHDLSVLQLTPIDIETRIFVNILLKARLKIDNSLTSKVMFMCNIGFLAA